MQGFLKNIRSKEKLFNLRYYDTLILTIILFGTAIYSSTTIYLDITGGVSEGGFEEALNFSEWDNWRSFISQSIYLMIAAGYLYLRNFDFGRFRIKPGIKAFGLGIIYFIIISLVMDVYFMLVDYAAVLSKPSMLPFVFSDVSVSLVLYSLLNGFYEEIFFLGICMAVDEKYIIPSYIYSLIVRFSFHCYQGIAPALGIGLLMGSVFFLLYRKSKDKNLLPFFLGHAIADIFGLSLIAFFY